MKKKYEIGLVFLCLGFTQVEGQTDFDAGKGLSGELEAVKTEAVSNVEKDVDKVQQAIKDNKKKPAVKVVKESQKKPVALSATKKKAVVKKISKKTGVSHVDPFRNNLEEAARILKQSVEYLVENAYFMADVEPGAEDVRLLAIKIYKTEAYCVLFLAGFPQYITWGYPQNPFQDMDVYYDGIELFYKKSALIFGDVAFHRTQVDRLMFSLRGSIHENILSLVHCLNNYLSVIPENVFKFNGRAYEDICLTLTIDLYEQLSTKTVEWIDRSYQQWQVVFYRSLLYMLKELALVNADRFHEAGNDDAYFDLKAIGKSSTLTLEKVKKSIPRSI